MRLWIVTVGVSDVQFPIVDQSGKIVERHELAARPPRGANSIREVHEWLLAQSSRLDLLNVDLPQKSIACGMKVSQDSLTALVGDGLPNPAFEGGHGASGNRIKLVFPKLARILQMRDSNTVDWAVLVVETNRDRFPGEPVASGRLVESFLSQELIPENGVEPVAKVSRVAILKGAESFEGHESTIEKRLIEALNAYPEVDECVIFSTGGMPQVKELLPWILDRRYPGKVKIAQVPEQGLHSVVNFHTRSHPTAMFVTAAQCAQQFERGDLAAARALARLLQPSPPWADMIVEFAGALDRTKAGKEPRTMAMLKPVFEASPLLRLAILIELDLRAELYRSALIRLGAFVELAAWRKIKAKLIEIGIGELHIDNLRRVVRRRGLSSTQERAVMNWVNELNDQSLIITLTDEIRFDLGGTRIQQWYRRLQLGSLADKYGLTPRNARNALAHAGHADLIPAFDALHGSGVIDRDATRLGEKFLLREILNPLLSRAQRVFMCDLYLKLIRIARGAVPLS